MPGDVDAALSFLTSQSTVNTQSSGCCRRQLRCESSRPGSPTSSRNQNARRPVGRNGCGRRGVRQGFPQDSDFWSGQRRRYDCRGSNQEARRAVDEPGEPCGNAQGCRACRLDVRQTARTASGYRDLVQVQSAAWRLWSSASNQMNTRERERGRAARASRESSRLLKTAAEVRT